MRTSTSVFVLRLTAAVTTLLQPNLWVGKGVKNGALLRLMAGNGFDVLLAVDKNLPYQQNQQNLSVAVVILDVRRNVLSSLRRFVPELLRLLTELPRREVTVLPEPAA